MPNFKLQAIRGDTIVLKVPVIRNDIALDITGATFIFTGKRWQGDSVALVQKSGAAVSVPTPSNGIAYITIAPSDTASFTDTIIMHSDVEMTELSGRKTTVAIGTLEIIADITH